MDSTTSRPWSPVKESMRWICSKEIRSTRAMNMATLAISKRSTIKALNSGTLPD